MSFKLYACKGEGQLPLIEVPSKGGLIAERLSPGTIREADFWENFRKSKNGRLLFACPIGKTERGKCRGGQRLLRVWHKKANLKALLRECRSGGLSKRRAHAISKIMKDITPRIRRMTVIPSNGGGSHPFIAPHMLATTPMGKLGQFALTSLATVVMFMVWIRIFWPDEAPTQAVRNP